MENGAESMNSQSTTAKGSSEAGRRIVATVMGKYLQEFRGDAAHPGAGGNRHRKDEETRRDAESVGETLVAEGRPAQGPRAQFCSGVVVHDEDDRLCSACRRTLNDVGVTHLGKVRPASAQQLVTEARAEGSPMPASVLDTFQPTSDCLCMRTDCFATFFEVEGAQCGQFLWAEVCRVQSCRAGHPVAPWRRDSLRVLCWGGGGSAEGSSESSFVWSGEDACASVEREGLGVEPEGHLGRRREAHRRKLCPPAVRTLLHRARPQNRDTHVRLRSREGHQNRYRSCGCKGRSSSLMCGCRGSCQMGRAHSHEVSQVGDKAREDDNARDGDTCVPEDDGEGDDEPEIDVEADGEDGIPEWNKSDDESCEADDDEVDPLVDDGEMGGGISELLDDVQF